MKKTVIALFTLSICLASGNIQKQMDDLMKTLQYKYQISGPEDLYKLKTQQTTQHGRTASRDMGDLVGDWRVEEENMEIFITVASDQSIPDIMTLMAMVEAEGSITATASDYVAELTYLFNPSIMEGDDGGNDCDISCEDEYNDYNDYGIEPSNIYCECCHENWPLEDICEDDGGGGVGLEFEYESVADLYADYGSVLESMGTGCDGCTGNLDWMDANTSINIDVQSEFENWANNFEFAEYYFQFIDENENNSYDGGEIYAVSCEGDTSMTVAYDGSVYALQFEYFWMEAYDFDWESDDDYDNMLPNGEFENVYEAGNGWQLYATGWTWFPAAAVNHHVELSGNNIYGSDSLFEAFDGDYSLKLWGQFSGAENQTAYYQTFTDLEAGTEIHAEAMLMSHQDHWIGNGSNTVTVFASYWDAGWSFIGRDDSEVFSGADEYNMWHERWIDAVVPEGVSYVNIGLEFSQMDDSQTGSVYIDNMELYINDDDDREDNSRNYDALTFAQDYVNDNSSDWGENAFDLETEFSLVVDGDYVSGGLGGDDPGNCEINWPEDPYKMAVYSFVSEYVLVEGGSVGCFLDNSDLDQTYADFVTGMENEWAGGDGEEPPTPEDFLDWFDANGDGVLTLDEIINGINETNYESGEPPLSAEDEDYIEYTFNVSDENGDGVLDLDELENFIYMLENDDDNDDYEPDLLIMNMDLMEFFMASFGMDLDSLNIENPTVLAVGSSNDDENIDMVMGMMFVETGIIELMADSAEAVAATSIDETSITFTNLSLYDSTGTAILTVTGTIAPGWIDFEAGVETPIDLFNEDGEEENREFYVSLSEDSTGMEISVEYDDDYGEEYSDTSYFNWSATTDSLFLYYESDYYYEDEADTMALGYMIIEDTLFASVSFNPCEDDGYESYEECFGDMDLPGFDELVDVVSFRVNQETVFTSTVLTSIETPNGKLPEEFKLYSAYPNPFNPVTTIRFDVGVTSNESTLRIYDVSGRNVATLINGQLQPGSYQVQWDARGFASGIYFSELISGTKRHTQKMVLLK